MIIASHRYKGLFIPQKTPNRWSCVPTSFAIAIGQPVEKIIQQIGHNGSEIIRPDFIEPRCRRGFHAQELFKICYHYGFLVTEYQVEPYLFDGDFTYYIENDSLFIEELLLDNIGVLGGFRNEGKPHSVAWDGTYIVDPSGFIYTRDLFTISVFYLIKEVNDDTFPKENSEPNQKKVFTSETLRRET